MILMLNHDRHVIVMKIPIKLQGVRSILGGNLDNEFGRIN